MAPQRTDPPLNPGRRLIFWGVIGSVPILVLIGVEITVRLLLGDVAPIDRYITFSNRPEFFETVEIDGRPHYRVSHPQAYRARNTIFPVEKPEDTLRIFCLGGSASAGWPHPPDEIWTVVLAQALEAAFPERAFEVINVGAHAYPSYRIRFIFERVLDFDPDAIVIYSGNNEFLETRTYLRDWAEIEGLAAIASRSVSFRRLRSWYIRMRYPENTLSGEEGVDVSLNVWSKLAQSSLALREDPEQFAAVMKHFAATIGSLIEQADARGVPLLLATVPVNLRDWVPNVSINPLDGPERELWEQEVARGRGALLDGDAEEAVGMLTQAVEQLPINAEAHYRLAQALEATGDFGRMMAEYQRASDLDHNPFRAMSDHNVILRKLAAENTGAGLADLDSAFRAASEPMAPGFDLFLDYVHPNKRGSLIAARTVFDALLRDGLLGTPPPVDAHFSHTPSAYVEDHDDHLQNTLFWLYGMMHQYQAMLDKAEHLQSIDRDLPLLRPILRVFRDHLYMERRRLRGEPIGAEERQRIEARVDDYYQHTYHFEQ